MQIRVTQAEFVTIVRALRYVVRQRIRQDTELGERGFGGPVAAKFATLAQKLEEQAGLDVL